MNKLYCFLTCFCVLGLMASCGSDEYGNDDMQGEKFLLELSVSSRNAETGQTDIKEREIKSIYAYAFDDNYPTSPDYMFDTGVKGGESGTYQLNMPIHDRGKKRFYLFVNPPANIKEVLVPKCPEERLKSLLIYQNTPMADVYDTGLPMSNCFEAYVDGVSNDSHNDGTADEVFLYPDMLKKTNRIVEIPVFRSLGKITVQAYVKGEYDMTGKGAQTSAVALKIVMLKIFNFNADGSALPLWETNGDRCEYWELAGNTTIDNYVWNKDLKLDLKAMSKNETMIINDISEVEIKNDKALSSSDRENPDYVTHFYLCQNSYGNKASSPDEQEGVTDDDGNRTTKMIVALSDGRVSEIALPYLRRNDNLILRLAINSFKIEVDFDIWKESVVTPEWDEEIHQNPIKIRKYEVL